MEDRAASVGPYQSYSVPLNLISWKGSWLLHAATKVRSVITLVLPSAMCILSFSSSSRCEWDLL